MKAMFISLIACAALAGCTSAQTSELQPIPGSITYNGQPRQKLTKSPVGSTLPHMFYTSNGDRVEETYVIQPDRSLKLVRRIVVPEDFPF